MKSFRFESDAGLHSGSLSRNGWVQYSSSEDFFFFAMVHPSPVLGSTSYYTLVELLFFLYNSFIEV